jgi:hypothetical protein
MTNDHNLVGSLRDRDLLRVGFSLADSSGSRSACEFGFIVIATEGLNQCKFDPTLHCGSPDLDDPHTVLKHSAGTSLTRHTGWTTIPCALNQITSISIEGHE